MDGQARPFLGGVPTVLIHSIAEEGGSIRLNRPGETAMLHTDWALWRR
jgi:hypothetical protein